MFIFSLNIFAQKTSGKNNEGLLLDLSFNNSFIDNSNTVPGIKPNNVKLIKDRYGKENSAAGFKEADSYINIPLNINPDKQPVITIILWAKIDDMRNKMAILSQDNGDYDRSVYVVDRRGAMFCGKDERVLTGSQVAAGSWFFIAAVYNQSTADILLFVNGNVFKRKAKTGQGLNYFYIGANPSFGDSFSGAIDDVRIYDRALNKTEIQKVFEEEKKESVFFFKQKTAYEIYQCDWSSDVCSSDLVDPKALTSSTTSESCASLRSQRASVAPSLANRIAVARPIPEAAPVMSERFASKMRIQLPAARFAITSRVTEIPTGSPVNL